MLCHEPESFWLDPGTAHGAQHIAQPFRPVAQAEPASEPEQSGSTAAYVGDIAQQLVPGDPGSVPGAFHACTLGLVGGIAGHQGALLQGSVRPQGTQIPQHRGQIGEPVLRHGLLQQPDRLRLNVQPVDLPGGHVPFHDQGDDAAARAQVACHVPYLIPGKGGKEKGVRAEPVGMADADVQPAQGFPFDFHMPPPSSDRRRVRNIPGSLV